MTTINTNVGALQARTYAVSSGIRQQTSMERLSSGLRINSAADDAAGLAVANKMKSQLRGLEMAVRNSMDGVSLIQTAEAAMGEVTNMVIRMRELAVQMHNGVYTDADRNNAQLEVEALKSEIDKVCANTAFNDVKLLDGSFETYFRAGDTNQEIVDVKIDGVCLDQLGGEYVDRRSISVIDEIPPDEPTDTFLETVRFEKARTTIEASEASKVTIAQSQLGISEFTLPQSGQYSLRGIDADEFTIDTATGNITSVGAIDYEAPTGGVASNSNEYKFDVVFKASDGTEYVDEVTLNVVTTENQTNVSLKITDISLKITETHNLSFNEIDNRITGTDINFLVESDIQQFGLAGNYFLTGENADKFVIDANGVIQGIGNFDFENPSGGSEGNSNIYEFEINYFSNSQEILKTESVTLEILDDEISFSTNAFSGSLRATVLVEEGVVTLNEVDGITASPGFTSNDWINSNNFSIEGSQEDIDAALASLSYAGGSGNISIIITPSNVSYNPDNGHFYQYDSVKRNWADAIAFSGTQTLYGLQGYLATLTSAAELNFVISKAGIASSFAWLGGSDEAVEGEWRWVQGPENGMQFWQGGRAAWGGTAVNGMYSNWRVIEPNNFTSPTKPTGEDHLVISSAASTFYDVAALQRFESVIEYSGSPNGDEGSTIIVNPIFELERFEIAKARRISSEIIVSYGDSLISEASTEFNLTETPSFTMELSNFELLKDFSETFEGGTFNISGLDVSNVSINQQTGELILSSLNFESPNDSDSDNVYEFVINYEANGNIFIQNVKINILDVQPATNTFSTTLETGNNNVGQTRINTSSDHHVSIEFLEYVEQNPGGTFSLTGADSNLENTRSLNTSMAAGVASGAADTSATSTLTIGTNTPSGTAAYSFDETDITDSTAATAISSIAGTARYALGANSPTGVSLVDNLDGTFVVTIETDRTGSPLPANATSFTIEIEDSASPGTTVFTHTINLNVTDLTPFIELDSTNGEISFNNLNLGPGDANADGVYELQLDYCVGLERISELLSIEFNGGQAEVVSTSETTPAILTKVSQQGLATRLDYQITEARGFKVHAPEDAGDREELKKFIDVNPRGTFALSGADAAKFTVDIDGMIKSQSQIDYERQNSYEFELTYTSGDASYKESYFLTVVDDPADNVKHLRDIGVGTRASSAEAVEILNIALDQLTASRAKLGAIENRLTYNISNLTKASMLTDQASGRITDADFAQETSELAKNQILNQASMAMLSQANQSKQNVLQLLG